MKATKPGDLSRLFGKWLTAPDGARWRLTCLIKGTAFGRLNGLESSPLEKIPAPWTVES